MATALKPHEIRRKNLQALAAARKAGDWETVKRLQSDLQKDWNEWKQ